MMLREIFSALGFPRGGAEFVAERIAGRPSFCVARDRSGKATVLISHNAKGGVDAPASIELRHAAFWAAAECEITSLRVDATVVAALGGVLQDGVTQRFNAAASASTLRIFDGAQVPCVPRSIPVEVSEVRFKVELDGLVPASDSLLGRVSPFHAAFCPTMRPERWTV